jgi:hypothetical protein
MWFWPTETKHVDVFTGDRTNNLGSGDEDPAFRRKDHDVSEGRTICGTARCGSKYDRDLGDSTRSARHRSEYTAHSVETCDTFAKSCSTGMPEPDDGSIVSNGTVIGGHDGPAAIRAHCPTLHGGIGRECHDIGATDISHSAHCASVICGGDQGEFTLVKERAKPH